MPRSTASAGAILCAALLLLAHPAIADPIAREAGRLLGSKAVNTDCSDLHVPGCRLWEAQWASRYAWLDDHAVRDAAASPDGATLYLAGPWTPGYGHRPDMGLVAADAATGEARWLFHWDGPAHRYDRPERVLLSPDGATAYLVGVGVHRVDAYEGTGWSGESYTYRGYVHAIATDDGTRLWTASFGPGESAQWVHGWLNDAALSPDGALLVVAGQVYGATFDDTSGRVAALHAATGVQAWRHDVAGEGFIDVTGVAFDGQGRVVAVANANGTATMEALDAATGSRVHNLTLYEGVHRWASPELALDAGGGRAAVTVERGDRAWRGVLVNLTAPAVAWTRAIPAAPGYWENPPAAWHPTMDQVAFGGAGGPDHGGVIVVDAATGATAWTRAGDRGPSYWHLAFSPDGERLVAAGATSSRAVALGINGTTGHFEWSTAQRDAARGSNYAEALFVGRDVLLAGTTDLSSGSAWLANRVSGTGNVTPDAAQPAADRIFS